MQLKKNHSLSLKVADINQNCLRSSRNYHFVIVNKHNETTASIAKAAVLGSLLELAILGILASFDYDDMSS